MDLLHSLGVVGGLAFFGAGIKYIDEVYDEGTFSRKYVMLLTIFGSILLALAIVLDAVLSSITLAIIFSAAIQRKIDNEAFRLGIVIILATLISVFALFPLSLESLLNPWLGLLSFLVLMGVLDEYANDWADKQINKSDWRHHGSYYLRRVLFYRPIMKLATLGLVILNVFSVIYFIAFMAFDGAYHLVDHYSKKIKARMGRLVIIRRGIR